MMMMKYLVVLFLIIQLSNLTFGHLCLFEPLQRKPDFGVPIQPGDNACYQVNGNCGNTTAGPIVGYFKAGSTAQVFFQQNYNHFYKPNIGYLDVAISYNGDNGSFITISDTISDFNAWDMVSQTNYTVNVNIPNQTCKNCVLRVRYVSNNAGEPYPDFYQCSDISVM